MKKYFILSIVIALYASPGNIFSAENKFMELDELITANKICKNEIAGNDEVLVCRYKINNLVELEIHRVGLGDARVMINKSDRDKGLYVQYNKASGCIMITIGRNPKNLIRKYAKGKKIRGAAHISLFSGKVYENYRLCEVDGN